MKNLDLFSGKNLGAISIYKFAHISGTANLFKAPTFILIRDYCNIPPEIGVSTFRPREFA
jgi:hypothetical protein